MLPINKTISIIERDNIAYRNYIFKPYNLKGYQSSLLLEICKHPQISQEQLTKNMHIDKSNVARGLQSLESLGYINRVANPNDLRIFLCEPTPKGLEIYHEIVEVLKKQRKYLMQDFTEETETQFLAYLELLKNRATQLIEGINHETSI